LKIEQKILNNPTADKMNIKNVPNIFLYLQHSVGFLEGFDGALNKKTVYFDKKNSCKSLVKI